MRNDVRAEAHMTTTTVAIGTMKVAQVSKPGADFQIVEREIPEPRPGQVRIKVQACGVCHSDTFTKEVSFAKIASELGENGTSDDRGESAQRSSFGGR
jgi:hypothetical protein